MENKLYIFYKFYPRHFFSKLIIMKREEILKIGEEISKVLQSNARQDLVKELAKIIFEYESLKEELNTFVKSEIESESDESIEDVEIEDEDLVIKVEKGFHSIK
jgi:hypothetical protein